MFPPGWQNALDAWQIAFTAPQVIAHRTARLAASGHTPNARDRKEFTRMGQEKFEAFGESMFAMAMQMYKMNQEFALLAAREWWSAWAAMFQLGGRPPRSMAAASNRQLLNSFSQVAQKGLTPVRKRVKANAKRLGRVRP